MCVCVCLRVFLVVNRAGVALLAYVLFVPQLLRMLVELQEDVGNTSVRRELGAPSAACQRGQDSQFPPMNSFLAAGGRRNRCDANF